MKNTLVVATCILLGFVSCKKPAAPAPVSVVTATIDGVSENFIVSSYSTHFDGTNHALSIFAVAGKNANADQIFIVISRDSVLTAKTYTNIDKTGLVNIDYINGAISTTDFSNQYTTDHHGAYPTSVTINTFTSATLQGTFNGTLISVNGITKTVTGGQFKVYTTQPNTAE